MADEGWITSAKPETCRAITVREWFRMARRPLWQCFPAPVEAYFRIPPDDAAYGLYIRVVISTQADVYSVAHFGCPEHHRKTQMMYFREGMAASEGRLHRPSEAITH